MFLHLFRVKSNWSEKSSSSIKHLKQSKKLSQALECVSTCNKFKLRILYSRPSKSYFSSSPPFPSSGDSPLIATTTSTTNVHRKFSVSFRIWKDVIGAVISTSVQGKWLSYELGGNIRNGREKHPSKTKPSSE